MATDALLVITPYGSTPLTTEYRGQPVTDLLKVGHPGNTLTLLEKYSFDVEQILNIGSQSTGAGAGKITFNPFAITKRVDSLTPTLFQHCASGTPFARLDLLVDRTDRGQRQGLVFIQFTFKLVAVKTVSWSDGEDDRLENVSFEYGGLQVRYALLSASGQVSTVLVGGWNRVRNVADLGNEPIR